MAPPNLKRSGFVKIPFKLSLSRNAQNKVSLFFWWAWGGGEPHYWIDKAFLHTFDAQKVW